MEPAAQPDTTAARQTCPFPQRRTRCNKALIGTTTLLLLVVLSGLGSWFSQAHTSSTHAANASSWYQKAI